MSAEVIVKATYKDDEHVWIDGKLFIRLSRVNKMMLEQHHRLMEEHKQPSGAWVKGKYGTDCSRCGGGISRDLVELVQFMRFCPFCGAEMEGWD